MAELQDTDLMLVNRGGKSYKATGAEIKDSLNPSVVTKPQIIAPAEGAGIAIGAESDEIIAVGATSYTAGATSEYMENLDGAFNGILDENEYTAMRPSSNAGTSSNPEFTFETPVPFGTLRVWARTPGSGVSPGNIEGKTLSDNSWSQIVPQNNTGMNWFTWSKTNDSLVAIRMRSSTQAAGAAIGAFEVDGNLLLNTTDLTFASNKNLTGDPSFAEGDPVQQDSGYTPTTSAITDVKEAAGPIYSSAPTTGSTFSGNEWDKLFDGKISGPPGAAGLTTAWNSATIDLSSFDITGEIILYTYLGNSLTWGFNGAQATSETTSIVNGDSQVIKLKTDKLNSLSCSQTVQLLGIEQNGRLLIDGESLTTLTLTDDTDLENFRVGDVVKQEPYSVSSGRGEVYVNESNKIPSLGTSPGSIEKLIAYDNIDWLDTPVTFEFVTPKNGGVVAWYDSDSLEGPWLRQGSFNNGDTPNLASWTTKQYVAFEGAEVTPTGISGEHCFNLTSVPAAANSYQIVQATVASISGTTMTVNPKTGTWSANGTNYASGPDTTPATGTVASTDSGANTMVLSAVDETFPKRWIANAGKFVVGEQFPSKNAAPDVDGLTLIATDFVDSPYGSLTHGSSDWQVAAFSDTSYSAPVASATGDATNKTTWEATPTLEEGTRYRARVRYKADSGEESPWSDDTTFETKSNPFAQLEPCNLWQNFGGATSTWGKIVAPAPVINAGQYYMNDGRRNFAICTDGKIYSSAANTANSSADAVMTPPSNPAISGLTDLVNFWGAYQSSNINDWVALKTDGSIVNGQGYTDLDGKKVIGFYPLGPVSRMMLLKTDDNEIWCYSMISNTYNIGSETTSNRGLFKLNIGGFPAGVELVDVVGGTSNNSSGGYDTACLIFLGSDGKIYTSASTESNAINCMSAWGFSATGRNESVYQETTFPANFKALYGGSTYSTEACFSALTEDGDLWFAGLGGNKITNGERAFSLFDDTNKYLSGIVCTYQVTNSYSLRADGKLWGKFQGYVTTGKDYVEIEVPDYNGTLGSLGGICGNINCYGVALPYPAPIQSKQLNQLSLN